MWCGILQGGMRVDGLEGFMAGNARSHPDKAEGCVVHAARRITSSTAFELLIGSRLVSAQGKSWTRQGLTAALKDWQKAITYLGG
jgi:hypothetical protein